MKNSSEKKSKKRKKNNITDLYILHTETKWIHCSFNYKLKFNVGDSVANFFIIN